MLIKEKGEIMSRILGNLFGLPPMQAAAVQYNVKRSIKGKLHWTGEIVRSWGTFRGEGEIE